MYRIIALSAVLGLFVLQQTWSCNEAVCGSIVSKCLLTQACKCDFKNCTCCKDCFACLGNLYSECCSCVDMCPKPIDDNENALSKMSNVETFSEAVPGLFEALTTAVDAQKRWFSLTYQIHHDLSQFKPKTDVKIQMQSAEQEVVPIKAPSVITLNCTVAFISNCTNLVKCKGTCQTMGASSYRWFHDGCCECVGQHCINYGIEESKCRDCPNEDEEVLSEEDYDYGDGDGDD